MLINAVKRRPMCSSTMVSPRNESAPVPWTLETNVRKPPPSSTSCGGGDGGGREGGGGWGGEGDREAGGVLSLCIAAVL